VTEWWTALWTALWKTVGQRGTTHGAKKKGRLASTLLVGTEARNPEGSVLFGDDLDRDVHNDVGVRSDRDGVLADRLQRAVGQADLRLGDREAVLAEGFGDVGVRDRTEQAAVDARLLRDADGLARQLLADGLRGGELFGRGLLELGGGSRIP